MKLTEADRQMLSLIIETPSMAWVTAENSPSHAKLLAWEEAGYFDEVEAPAPILVAYRITEAGRIALSEIADGGSDAR